MCMVKYINPLGSSLDMLVDVSTGCQHKIYDLKELVLSGRKKQRRVSFYGSYDLNYFQLPAQTTIQHLAIFVWTTTTAERQN